MDYIFYRHNHYDMRTSEVFFYRHNISGANMFNQPLNRGVQTMGDGQGPPPSTNDDGGGVGGC